MKKNEKMKKWVNEWMNEMPFKVYSTYFVVKPSERLFLWMNRATIKRSMHVSPQKAVCFGIVSRSGMAGSYGRPVFNWQSNIPTDFLNGWVYFSHQQWIKSCLLCACPSMCCYPDHSHWVRHSPLSLKSHWHPWWLRELNKHFPWIYWQFVHLHVQPLCWLP